MATAKSVNLSRQFATVALVWATVTLRLCYGSAHKSFFSSYYSFIDKHLQSMFRTVDPKVEGFEPLRPRFIKIKADKPYACRFFSYRAFREAATNA